jgi:hypothetical protein
MIQTFLITVVVFAIAMTAMAVGAILTRGQRCIRGTCGGDTVVGPEGEDLLCDACPKRKNKECLPGSEREAACADTPEERAAV